MAQSVFKSEQGRRAIVACYENALAEAASRLPLRRRIVQTALGDTHVIEAGDASRPPLVLLHGTASNSATWLADIPVWSRHFRVVAADIVGEPGLSEDRRITLPIQFFAGSDDRLVHSAASVERLVRLLPHAEAYPLENCGHAILGKSDEILGFLVKSGASSTRQSPSGG